MPGLWPSFHPATPAPLARAAACVLVAGLALGGCERRASTPQPPAAAHSAAPHETAASAAPAVSDAPRVVFLGDSITAGLHLPADEAFPAVLERSLRAQGQPMLAVNAGVSGDTAAGGLRRIDWILRQRPAVVVIELGANDGLRGVALADIEANLRAIVERVKQTGATPLLLGMRLPPSYGAEYAAGFDAIYPRLAQQLAVRLVPFFMQGVAGVPEQNLEDGLHPTTEGQRKLAANAEAALREVLKERGAR